MSTQKSWNKIAIRDSKKRGVSRLTREYRNVAIHEAAHAVAAAALGIRVTKITMMPPKRPLNGGLTVYDNPLYNVSDADKNTAIAKLAVIAVAGAVGEMIARTGNTTFGARFFRLIGSESDMAELFDFVDNDKKLAVDFAKYALDIVEHNYDAVMHIADMLADNVTLDGKQCKSLLSGVV